MGTVEYRPVVMQVLCATSRDPTLTRSEPQLMMPHVELSAKNFDDPDEVVRLPGLIEDRDRRPRHPR
jgi:hypothetical protein